jgi:hypothetical protein
VTANELLADLRDELAAAQLWQRSPTGTSGMTEAARGEAPAMAVNKTVADLRVKSATVLEESQGPFGVGQSWKQPTDTFFVPGRKYKLEVVFGNASPPVTYPDERFRKDVIAIHIACRGFKVGSRYEAQVLPTFYTSESYRTTVPPVAGSTSQITVTFPRSLDTDEPDGEVEAYFRFNNPQLPQRAITTWVWRIGIYASVRDRVWRQTASSV